MQPIGYVTSERKELSDDFWGDVKSIIHLSEEFEPSALQGLSEFSHIDVYFLMHKVDPNKVICGARHPRNDKALPEVGIFAQRAKNRPNQLGHTTVKLIRVDEEAREIEVQGLDAIDGTPVLDIKPYIKQFVPLASTVYQPEWVDEIMKDYFA